MRNEALYNFAIEADKVAKNNGGCDACFCELIRRYIENSINLNKSFKNWKSKNKIYTICGSVLFYLQDLGIIEILSGVTTRDNGVRCDKLKYTINKQMLGNKI